MTANAWCKQSAGVTARVEAWAPVLARYPWPVATMLAIVCRESGGDPGAVNPTSGACGILQDLTCPWATVPGGDVQIAWNFANKYRPVGLAPWGY